VLSQGFFTGMIGNEGMAIRSILLTSQFCYLTGEWGGVGITGFQGMLCIVFPKIIAVNTLK